MTKHYISIIFLFVICISLNAQEYLLDSVSTNTLSQIPGGPQETIRRSKYNYDDQKRLKMTQNESSYNGFTYEIYTYSELKNVKEDFETLTDNLRFRDTDHFNEDGFIVASIRDVLTDEGDYLITDVDSLIRSGSNLIDKHNQYKYYYGELKIAQKTIYHRNDNGDIIYEYSDIYKNGTIVHDDVFYRDTTNYIYEDDLLSEIHRIRYNSEGLVHECAQTKYMYFDDHFVEIIEIAEDDLCEEYITWTESYSYYSESDYYAFDSIFVFGFREEGWGLFTERRTEEYFEGDDLIVAYEGSRLVAPTSEYDGILIHKDAEFLLHSESENTKLDFVMKPNLSPVNGMINLDGVYIPKPMLNIEVYDIRGAKIYSEVMSNNDGLRLVAPGIAGTYFVKVIDDESGRFAVKKLVVF